VGALVLGAGEADGAVVVWVFGFDGEGEVSGKKSRLQEHSKTMASRIDNNPVRRII